jgi:hypothetical protein
MRGRSPDEAKRNPGQPCVGLFDNRIEQSASAVIASEAKQSSCARKRANKKCGNSG